MRVCLLGQLDAAEHERWLQALRHALPEAVWLDEAEAHAEPLAVDFAVVANPTPGSLRGLTGLRLIQSLWAGVDRLLGDASVPAELPLARMVDPAMNAAMAETALWATLALHRGFFAYAAQQQQGLWQPLPQRRADELRVTVLGLGQMGSATAARLAAVGYQVTGWRTRLHASHGPASAEAEAHLGTQAWIEVAGEPALWPLLAKTDIVINLLPLTSQTRGLLNAAFFAALPPGAAVVNLARGAHVVEADLLAALDSGRLHHAVLDVFHQEPLPATHPFWRHPKVTVLPHAAAATDERSASQVVATNLRRVWSGQAALHLVQRDKGY